MKINTFTIKRAQGLNNFQPGGKEYWIVYLDEEEKKPYVFEELEKALSWMTDLAAPTPTKPIPIVKPRGTAWSGHQ